MLKNIYRLLDAGYFKMKHKNKMKIESIVNQRNGCLVAKCTYIEVMINFWLFDSQDNFYYK